MREFIQKKLMFFPLLILLQSGLCYGQGKWGINTQNIMMDIAPAASTIIGAMALGLSDNGLAIKGFGIGVQYEYMLSRNFSIGLRSAYTLLGAETQGLTLDIHSITAEGHVRWYPWRRKPRARQVFFLDGFMGYANIMINLTSEFTEKLGYKELIKPYLEDIEFSILHYFKGGAKAGFKFILWENGQYGSLVTEVALGYSLALGGGDDFDKHTAPFTGTIDSGLLAILGGVILAGGPRISLNIGWLY